MIKATTLGGKLISSVCALTVALSMTGAGALPLAFAQGSDGDASAVAASAPHECNNGWSLNYSVINSKVCITGVASVGSGSLTVPSQIDGMPVTIIGAGAFKDCTGLSTIVLPDTVTIFKSEAFCGSGLTKINVPASVTAVSYRCFKSCTKLTDLTFEGISLLYIGQESFMYCSSLVTLTLPWLTSHPIVKSNADDLDTPGVELFADSCAIGKSALAQCTSLETVVFDGVVGHETPEYFLDVSCLNGSSKIKNFVWKCKMDSVGSGQSGQKVQDILDSYYSLDFYNSEDDANNYTNKVASVIYEPKSGDDEYNVVKTLSLLNGTVDYSKYKYSSCTESIPQCPSGKVWGVADHGVLGDWDTLDDSYQVIAVDKDDLDYGWVSSPEIARFYGDAEVSSGASSMYDAGLPILYMESDGTVPDIENGLKVYAPDGNVLDSSNVKFEFQQADLELSGTGLSYNVKGWHSVDKVKGEGRYKVKAVNSANGTETPEITFTVAAFSPKVYSYTNYNQVNALGSISSDLAAKLSDTPEYNVIASCSDWHAQLIGAGLAGTSGGLMLLDDGKNTSSEAYHAHVASKASSVQILGSADTVPQSTNISSAKYLSDWILSNITGDQTRYRNDATAQALSNQVYNVMSQDYFSSKYGSCAVVASGIDATKALVVAQTAYQEKAPVFFTNAKGELSSADLASLKSGGFTKVVIAGDESAVSASCASNISSQTGASVSRVLNTGSSAYEASVAYAEQMVADGNSYSTVAIADGTSSASITLAAQAAALNKGVVLVCSSARDVKAAQSYLSGILKTQGSTTVKNVYICGNFKEIDSNVKENISAIWSSTGGSDVTDADSFEVNGSAYVKTGTGTAKLVKAASCADNSFTTGSVSYDGSTYKVTAVGANAFGSNATSVTIGADVKSLDAGAFACCPKLKTLNVKSKSVTKIAASMFAGLDKLASASFAGNVASIGKKAFNGCKALKALTIKSTKLKASKIGANAFTGTAAKITVKVPKAKLKTYKKLFIKKGLSKKANFKKC